MHYTKYNEWMLPIILNGRAMYGTFTLPRKFRNALAKNTLKSFQLKKYNWD